MSRADLQRDLLLLRRAQGVLVKALRHPGAEAGALERARREAHARVMAMVTPRPRRGTSEEERYGHD